MEKNIYFIQPYEKGCEDIKGVVLKAVLNTGCNFIFEDGNTSVEYEITKADIIIADISNASENLVSEVNFANTNKKPIILIAENGIRIPASLTRYKLFIYNLNDIDDCVLRLTKQIEIAISEPIKFSFSEQQKHSELLNKVFISYSHKDKDYFNRILTHLKPIEANGLIDLWVDTRIMPGDKWKTEVEKSLKKANVAILLISADYLASDFIVKNELPPLLNSAEENGTRIISIILKPCRFSRDKNLNQFQAINDPEKPLIKLQESGREQIYDNLAKAIEIFLSKK